MVTPAPMQRQVSVISSGFASVSYTHLALEKNGFILHEVLPIEGLVGGLCVYLRILAADYAWIPDYLKAKKGVTWDFKVEWQWERYKIGEKLFAALCKNKAGQPIVSLKCEPEVSLLLQGEYPGIQPGYYCDKKHWISIRLDGSVPDTVIKQRLDTAYTLVLHLSLIHISPFEPLL